MQPDTALARALRRTPQFVDGAGRRGCARSSGADVEVRKGLCGPFGARLNSAGRA
jgi:hypothetical protein